MTSAGREVLKWVALLLMTGDHVNKALLDGAAPWLGDAGRVVFPVFAFVLAWNLHNASPASRAASVRRLVIAGLLVQPLHAVVFGFWTPATVLLTLALGLFVADGRHALWLRLLAFAAGSLFVDYQWAGVAFVAASVYVIRHLDGMNAWAALAVALVPLCLFNGNAWAILSLPLLWWLGAMPGTVPRWRWTFLAYYVAHLAVLALLIGV